MKQPKLTNYVSEIDQFLQTVDKKYPTLSTSQKKEIEKYQRIYYLRDTAKRSDETNLIWEGF